MKKWTTIHIKPEKLEKLRQEAREESAKQKKNIKARDILDERIG